MAGMSERAGMLTGSRRPGAEVGMEAGGGHLTESHDVKPSVGSRNQEGILSRGMVSSDMCLRTPSIYSNVFKT